MKKQKEPYLKIPAHILNLTQICLCKKVLLVHIYGFGAKGCWQSKETMAEIFMVSQRTIERWLAAIRKFIYAHNGKGYYRTIWAKSHPDFNYDKNVRDVRQNWRSDSDKFGVRVRQDCHTTNNNTITENNKRTIASPSPRYRMQTAAAEIEKFKEKFSRASRLKPLTPQQFQQRRTQQLAALQAKQNI